MDSSLSSGNKHVRNETLVLLLLLLLLFLVDDCIVETETETADTGISRAVEGCNIDNWCKVFVAICLK